MSKLLKARISLLQDGRTIAPDEEFECCCEASAAIYLEKGWCVEAPKAKPKAKKKAKAETEE